MRVTRVQHVSVNVHGTDLADTSAFYRDVLGLDDADRPEIPGVPGSWHTVGGAQIHVVGAAARGVEIDPVGNHFCCMVESLDAAIAELEAREQAYVRAVQGENVVQIWITDPAGNTIELQQETERA